MQRLKGHRDPPGDPRILGLGPPSLTFSLMEGVGGQKGEGGGKLPGSWLETLRASRAVCFNWENSRHTSRTHAHAHTHAHTHTHTVVVRGGRAGGGGRDTGNNKHPPIPPLYTPDTNQEPVVSVESYR